MTDHDRRQRQLAAGLFAVLSGDLAIVYARIRCDPNRESPSQMCKQLHNGLCPCVSKAHILRAAAVGIGLAYSQGRIGNALDRIENPRAASDP